MASVVSMKRSISNKPPVVGSTQMETRTKKQRAMRARAITNPRFLRSVDLMALDRLCLCAFPIDFSHAVRELRSNSHAGSENFVLLVLSNDVTCVYRTI